MKGLIFSIKKFAIHDGPGIRVTFFMKGCNLNCWWCHNPEGIAGGATSVEKIDRIGSREFRREEQVGREYSVDDVLSIAARERVFFEHSGGGITFSGGEPMLQPAFLREALMALRLAGYHTVVDTSGAAPAEEFRAIMPYTSLFLFDLKVMDELKHIEYTGISNKLIIANLRMLLRHGADVHIRVPVVPGHNDDEKNLGELFAFVKENLRPNLKGVDLLPFHRIGASKYTRFGLPYLMGDTSQPDFERMDELKVFFAGTGAKVKVGG